MLTAVFSKLRWLLCMYSLVPRPPPRYYLEAVEIFQVCAIKSGRRPGNRPPSPPQPRFYLEAMEIFHSCEIKSGQRPGNRASCSCKCTRKGVTCRREYMNLSCGNLVVWPV